MIATAVAAATVVTATETETKSQSLWREATLSLPFKQSIFLYFFCISFDSEPVTFYDVTFSEKHPFCNGTLVLCHPALHFSALFFCFHKEKTDGKKKGQSETAWTFIFFCSVHFWPSSSKSDSFSKISMKKIFPNCKKPKLYISITLLALGTFPTRQL
ncbi:hypothetical protein [Sulfurimonas sp. HSL3-7]|uniref:hypothetical protein n=1 Tax=Sulfonitrofixus jiaomeiensis TaxID=3131938 RepID=UPI0031F7A982